MAVAQQRSSQNYLARAPSPGSGLVDVLDVILDKGLVIDAYVRVSLIGIELLTIDARIVIASVDTYLKFAQAVNRLDIASEEGGLPDLLEHGMEGLTKEGQQDREKERREKQDGGSSS
jgi:gas vesicle structural protein